VIRSELYIVITGASNTNISFPHILKDSDRAIASQVGQNFLVGEIRPICEFIRSSKTAH